MDATMNTVILILSLLAIFLYQFSSFSYASTLLVGGANDKRVFLLLALFNTSLFALMQVAGLHLYIILPIYLVILAIEFKLISKTDFIQVLCGASIFVLHLSAILTPSIMIVSNMVDLTPVELVSGTVYDNIIIIVTCAVLGLAHEVVKKFLDSKSIQRVTVKSKHSVILLISIMIILLVHLDHSSTMLDDYLYPEQMLLSLTLSIGSMLIFYLFFLYAISLIDANLYKRYSDSAISEQKQISEQKENLITKIIRDELTGVYNRRYIMNMLDNACSDEQFDKPFYVLFIDINALKYTNDTYGHNAGDRLIIKISRGILNAVRENDIVARIGGDEFLVLLTDVQGESCDAIISRILKNIEAQDKTEEFLVSASVGYVYVDEAVQKLGASHILSVADENMRRNKELFYEKMKGGSL